jgi:hypothetical protein
VERAQLAVGCGDFGAFADEPVDVLEDDPEDEPDDDPEDEESLEVDESLELDAAGAESALAGDEDGSEDDSLPRLSLR